MAEPSGNAVLYAPIYDDVDPALADLAASEQLHAAEVIGNYDAAVVDKKDGEPHIISVWTAQPSASFGSGWDRERSP
ncbi:MAG: hypothetical protein JOY58_07515, partial [Solirubrobacterales bacterium]|nr:hypothetical protein [Solirubrobacterales bacterium]